MRDHSPTTSYARFVTTMGRSPPPRVSGAGSTGATFGLAAAALFGASTPIAKHLVPGSGPLMLAGLLYLGAGLGLLAMTPFRRRHAEAPLRLADLPALTIVIMAGGVLGPVLLVLGLARLSGATASLLLNLEVPFTIGLAVVMLREPFSVREASGAAAVILGAVALAWTPSAIQIDHLGVLFVTSACAAWALDNGVSQRLSIRDPVAVVRVKALSAGTFNVVLGLVLGERLPSARHLGTALITGALGYGLSLVLHLMAVRSIGAARQAAYFATAPFVGAIVSVPLLHDRLLPSHLAAGLAMGAGIAIVVRADHGHRHEHPSELHDHAHVHDEHHAHDHAEPVLEPHSHVHGHVTLFHDHPHSPDIHHRHIH